MLPTDKAARMRIEQFSEAPKKSAEDAEIRMLGRPAAIGAVCSLKTASFISKYCQRKEVLPKSDPTRKLGEADGTRPLNDRPGKRSKLSFAV